MYFNNDIKINKFINRSDFNNYLNCMFRTDSSQNLTNDLTPKNKCYTMDNPVHKYLFKCILCTTFPLSFFLDCDSTANFTS